MRLVAIALCACTLLWLGCEEGGESKHHRIAAGAGAGKDDNLVLAKVDDVVITVADLQDRLNRMSPYVRARYTSLEQKKEFLDSLVRFEVLAKEAERRGFDRDPEVIRAMKQVMIQKLMKDEFEVKVTPDLISDAEIAAYYHQHEDEFVKPAEVRASAIILKTRAQADRVAALAAGPDGKTNKGFRDLVTTYTSNEDLKLRGGDLRYMTHDAKDWPRPVVDAAFALPDTGDVSGVIDAGDGTFWVLKQTGKRIAITRSIDDASSQIRNKLYREKRIALQKQFIDDLRRKAKITVDDDNLAKVRLDLSNLGGGDPHEQESPPLPDMTGPRDQVPQALSNPGGP